MIKKIITLIIFLLIVSIAVASNEFEITLIAYDSETQSAQIGIKNIGTQDYTNLTVAVDDLPPRNVVGLIKQGNGVKVSKGFPPGEHSITVSTAEGVTVKKNINFPKSESQVRRELEIKKGFKGTEETKLMVYEKKKDNNKLYIVIALILLILIFVFILKRRRRKPKEIKPQYTAPKNNYTRYL